MGAGESILSGDIFIAWWFMLYRSVIGVKETGSSFSALITLLGLRENSTGVSDLPRGLIIS